MKNFLLLFGTILFLSCNQSTEKAGTDNSLPYPPPEFKGTIGTTFEDSKEDYPQPRKAPEGAPNVLIILLDDVGFGQAGVMGGPIPTPAMDQLAASGLTYTRFHTTGICSPTRAALLTGRNHHQTGFGTISELSTGYPGYNSIWGKDVGTVAEVLKQNGYSTAAWGKWHNTPDWETSPIGPFGQWPTGLGFEYFYGFQGGAKIDYKKGDKGVIVANGGSSAGYTLFIKDNKLCYFYNYFHLNHYEVVSATPLPEGKLDIGMTYTQESKEYGGGGTARLFVNGKEVGSGKIGHVVPARYSATETMDIGKDLGSTVSAAYKAPFSYTGNIDYVQFKL